jgi:N-dimethylarginine dimethylaminohydrolase
MMRSSHLCVRLVSVNGPKSGKHSNNEDATMIHQVGRLVVVSHPSRRRLFPSATHNNRTQQRTIVAITRALPDTFADALQEFSTKETTTTKPDRLHLHEEPPPPPLCLATCRAQHAAYVRILEQHVESVVTLPALNAFPDSVFVEDTMVAVGGEVVLTRPGHESRVGEVQYMQEALLQHPQLQDRVTILDDMRSPRRQRHGHDDDNDEVPTCDGGDILRLGDHTMLVGMSHRTNAAGYRVLQRAFSRRLDVLPIPAVVQGSAALHLKSVTTNLNDRSILVPSGTLGDLMVKAIHDALATVVHHHRKNITKDLTVYRLDDMLWCNVVALPGTVLAQEKLNDRSRAVLERACTEQNLDLVLVDTSALAVKDAALTCCSVLVDL